MISVEIAELFSSQVDADILERATRVILDHQGVDPEAGLTIVITNDEQIHQLNVQFRSLDAPTDVLSFPAGYLDPDSNQLYLGDVLISYPRARAQAQEAGHPVEVELLLLAIHGVLHLLGHDHTKKVEKTRMWAAQAEIMASLGYTQITLPE